MVRPYKIVCPCSKQNEVTDVISVTEDETIVCEMTYQVECPNSNESYCNKYLAITLPPGIRPKPIDINLRNQS